MKVSRVSKLTWAEKKKHTHVSRLLTLEATGRLTRTGFYGARSFSAPMGSIHQLCKAAESIERDTETVT